MRVGRAMWTSGGLGLSLHGGGRARGLWAEEGWDLEPPPRISAVPILGVHLPACSMGPCVHGLDEARGLFSSLQVGCYSSKGPVMWARHTRLLSSMCLRVLKGPLTREPEAAPGTLASCTGHFAQAEA